MPQSLLLSHPAFTSAPTAQPLRGLLLRAGTCDPQRLILPCWSLIAFPAGPMESHKCLGVPGSWLAAWGTKAQPSGLQAADSKVPFEVQRCLQGRAEAGMAPGIASLLGFFPVAILPPTPCCFLRRGESSSVTCT